MCPHMLRAGPHPPFPGVAPAFETVQGHMWAVCNSVEIRVLHGHSVQIRCIPCQNPCIDTGAHDLKAGEITRLAVFSGGAKRVRGWVQTRLLHVKTHIITRVCPVSLFFARVSVTPPPLLLPTPGARGY